jgi:predicted CXXCH cytochrome family protein
MTTVPGCNEERACPAQQASAVNLESIYATDDSVAIGATVQCWALPEDGDQEYHWAASGGRFLETDSYYALWKAPDEPAVVRITVTATLGDESAARNTRVAVGTYRPRHAPTYAGAGYCGLDCHQAEGHGAAYDSWVDTGHARAYAGVEAHPDYESGCAACHAVGYGDVNAQGWVRHNGGFDEIPIAKLEGVQCESCHGPLADLEGEILADHGVLAYDDSLFAIGPTEAPIGCTRCHDTAGSPAHPAGKDFFAEWMASLHDEFPAGVDLTDPQCTQCHTVQGFIARLAGDASVAPAMPNTITCVACHAPHGSANDADLRRPAGQDVCSACHTDEAHGPLAEPHAPQAQMLAGTGGFEYAGGDFPSTPHRNVASRGCAHCHYPSVTGGGSHSFAPDPASCQACHPEASGGSFGWSAAQREIGQLLSQLERELRAATPADSLTEAFHRAEFNREFVSRDASRGGHNYRYAKSLLEASIEDFEPGSTR